VNHGSVIDEETGRKFYLDAPDDLVVGRPLTFLLNLHGGGSFAAWQRLYFPAHDYADEHGLVIATPTAAATEPFRRWTAEADDEHLKNVVDLVTVLFGPPNIASFWLVGHSQGGMTARRLLSDSFFADRADGWLSLSGGRIGGVKLAEDFGPPSPPGTTPPAAAGPVLAELQQSWDRLAEPPNADLSFIFATGEHEIAELPGDSVWAQHYGAGARVRLPDVVDTEAGQVRDRIRESYSTPAWGLAPRPGVAEIYLYPGARGGRVIADVVRVEKGHTEGLEPNITAELVKMMVAAPGGKARGASHR
jgi:pimeloyl-ACP methyl ester carboxylesterase